MPRSITSKQKGVLVLVLLIIALVVLNYNWLDDILTSFLDTSEPVHVDRIIDGDTIESNGTSIRLLGINAPERGEYLYEEAKEFLEQEILNKTVYLKYGKEKYDKYDRILAYLYINRENVNIRLVENGFANYYFYGGKDEYSNKLLDAWQICLDKNINLCELSTNICAKCIEIIDSKTIKNICGFSCDINDWQIKTEGRNKFIFNKSVQQNEELEFELDLTNSGGSLFLRDSTGKLIEWKI